MEKLVAKTLGPYRILEELGEGGMGVVYLAEQEHPVRRRVALKVIKLGMDTVEVVGRFEAERQALALMNHSNIAKVLDAGATEDGRPYFVMEQVTGIPITEYCDNHKLGIRARLALFVQTCNAIQHAHQKGIIHRDIKPSNVIVTEEEGKLVPKVIDFGVAKAINKRLTERTLFTQYGALVGTPEYMSPEQAETDGLDVDTTTDIYSLGVLLYELLVGAVPLNLHDLPFARMQKAISEEEPPKLATRLSSLGDRATDIAERRRTDLRSLSKQIGGELDWITRRAIEKERDRRYPSASELAADVERYLRGAPIQARAPTAAYVLQKMVVRNKGPVAVAAGLIILLAGFAVAMAIQANRIAQEAETAQQVSAFMEGLFAVSDPSEARGNTITAREILHRGVERIETELADQPVVQARLMNSMGIVYAGLGLYEEAAPLLRKALAQQERELGNDHSDVADTLFNLAALLSYQGNFSTSEKLFQRSLDIRLAAPRQDPLDIADNLSGLATLYRVQGRFADSEPLYQRVLNIQENELGPEHADVAKTLNYMALLDLSQGEYGQAEALFLRALSIWTEELGPEHNYVAIPLNNLGFLNMKLGRYAQAETYYQRSLAIYEREFGPDHPDLVWGLTGLGLVYTKQRKYVDAESHLRRALVVGENGLGPEHPTLAWPVHGLANLYRDQDRPAEAEPHYKRALAIREKKLGTNHVEVAWTLNDLAMLYAMQGKSAEAEKSYRRALAIREASLGQSHPELADTLEDYAALLQDLKRTDEAQTLEARAKQIRTAGTSD